MNKQFTRRELACLRGLAAEAHSAELSEAMLALYERFSLWRGGQLSAFDLNDEIHQFHHDISRDLYKRYVFGDPDLAVLYAITHGVLETNTIAPEIMRKLEPMIESVRKFREENDEA